VNASIREVRDAIKPTGMGPVPVTIIGRASMVDKISDFVTSSGTFDPEATEQIRAQGRLGVYRGANIVQVENYTDEDGVPYIPANELWVMGGTVGKFALYGPTAGEDLGGEHRGLPPLPCPEGHRWPRPPPGAGAPDRGQHHRPVTPAQLPRGATSPEGGASWRYG
jgi:hypothetical protein